MLAWWFSQSRTVRAVISVTVFFMSLSSIGFSYYIDVEHVHAVKPSIQSNWDGSISESGWDQEAVEATLEDTQTLAEFNIVGDAQDHTNSNVRLWTFTVGLLGRHTSNYAQQTGDCVSFGWKNAIEYLQAIRLSREGGSADDFRPVFPPYMYGISRCEPDLGAGRLRGAGSTGGWAAKGSITWGALPADEPSVPRYSGSLADQWGRSNTPDQFKQIGKQYRIRSAALMRSASDAMNAICNGYPVTIASQFGTRTIRPQDGRMVAQRDGRWAHQMCLVGYDGSPGLKDRYFYCLNSWGERAHPTPIQGEPPGGFWIKWADVEWIMSQRDSYAFSEFDGFIAQQIDWSVIRMFNNQEQTAAESEIAALTQQASEVGSLLFWIRVWQVRIHFYLGVLGILIGMLLMAKYAPFGGRLAVAIALVLVLFMARPAAAVQIDFSALSSSPEETATASVEFGVIDPTFRPLTWTQIDAGNKEQPDTHVPDPEPSTPTPTPEVKPIEPLPLPLQPNHSVYAYTSKSCLHCPSVKQKIGTGDSEVHVIWQDYTLAPQRLQSSINRLGVPFWYYPEFDVYETGVRTLSQLKAQIKIQQDVRAKPTLPKPKPQTDGRLSSQQLRDWAKDYRGQPWTVSGESLDSHLVRDHGFQSSQLSGLTTQEKMKLHGGAHTGRLSNGSSCPNGKCPISRGYNVLRQPPKPMLSRKRSRP